MSSPADPKRGAERWVVAFVATSMVAGILFFTIAKIAIWMAVIAGIACLAVVPFVAARLPQRLTGGIKRHPVLSTLWFLLALVSIFQTSRLSAFMADPSQTWGSVIPDPRAIRHQCMAAYVEAADTDGTIRSCHDSCLDSHHECSATSRRTGTCI